MKTNLLIACFIGLFASFNAQINISIPDSNAVWIMEEYSGFQNQPNFHYIYFTNSDTVISGKKYTKLYNNVYPQIFGSCYVSAYRSDSIGKVYFVPRDSTKEYRLFDFSKNTGDTIQNIPFSASSTNGCGGASSFQFKNGIVDSVTFITRNARTFKKIFFTITGLGGGNIWMESIGSPQGGFYPIGHYPTGLVCMSHSDTTYYNCDASLGDCYGTIYDYSYTAGYCDTITINGIKKDNSIFNSVIKITPTCFSNNVSITFSNIAISALKIKVFNVFGQSCTEITASSDSAISLDLSNLVSGIYILYISDEKESLKIQKIIKP